MAIYAVHSSALDGDPVGAFDQARTLRLGFAWGALVFGPFWLLARGLWRAFAVWVLGAALVVAALASGWLAPGVASMLYWLSALYLGFEGRGLRGAAFGRSGRPLAGIVVAFDREDAERRFLIGALVEPARVAVAPRAAATPFKGASIIGSFPEAGR